MEIQYSVDLQDSSKIFARDEYYRKLEKLILFLNDNNISITGCGCCSSPRIYFGNIDNPSSTYEDFVFDAEDKRGSVCWTDYKIIEVNNDE